MSDCLTVRQPDSSPCKNENQTHYLLVNRMANTEAGEAMIVAISGDPFAADTKLSAEALQVRQVCFHVRSFSLELLHNAALLTGQVLPAHG